MWVAKASHSLGFDFDLRRNLPSSGMLRRLA